MQLRTLLRNGPELSLPFSISSTLFLSPRGCTPIGSRQRIGLCIRVGLAGLRGKPAFHFSLCRRTLRAESQGRPLGASTPYRARYNHRLHAISEYPERHRSLRTNAASPTTYRPATTRATPRQSRAKARNRLGSIPPRILEQRRRPLRPVGKQGRPEVGWKAAFPSAP